MQYRTLGRTGLQVSEIGYGGWGLGKAMWKGGSDEGSLQALHRAIDLGLNFIDTALAYGNGHSEELVGRVARERSETLYVATKVPPKNEKWPSQGTLDEVFPADHIVQSTEQSLSNLGFERIDLQQLHVWDPSWLAREEWYEALDQLRAEGKIRYFGVSVNDHQPGSAVGLVRSGKVDTVQVIYNIFDQSPEDELFVACRQENVGVIARVPFDEGALTGKITPDTEFPKGDWRRLYFKGDRKQEVHARVEELRQLLNGEVGTLPELALRFCLHHPAVSTVIPGMRSVQHVEENIAVSSRPKLSDRVLSSLRRSRWIRNFYPPT